MFITVFIHLVIDEINDDLPLFCRSSCPTEVMADGVASTTDVMGPPSTGECINCLI